MSKFELLWASIEDEIPGVKLQLRKDSKFLSTIFVFLKWLVKLTTFGKASADWSSYTSTIWRTVYVPDDFWDWSDERQYRLMRHELVHLRQFRKWPIKFLDKKYVWRVNAILMSFCYLLLPLPVFWTFRAKIEREGYLQSMLSHHELYGFNSAYKAWWVERMKNIFGGTPYFFMSTKGRAGAWAEKTIAEIEAGNIVNEKDNVLKWVA